MAFTPIATKPESTWVRQNKQRLQSQMMNKAAANPAATQSVVPPKTVQAPSSGQKNYTSPVQPVTTATPRVGSGLSKTGLTMDELYSDPAARRSVVDAWRVQQGGEPLSGAYPESTSPDGYFATDGILKKIGGLQPEGTAPGEATPNPADGSFDLDALRQQIAQELQSQLGGFTEQLQNGGMGDQWKTMFEELQGKYEEMMKQMNYFQAMQQYFNTYGGQGQGQGRGRFSPFL